MPNEIFVHYIEYDPFPNNEQKFAVSVSCRKPHTMRVVCNDSVVKTATVCNGKSEEVVEFDVPVTTINNICKFEFISDGKTVLTRTVRYKGNLNLYELSVNERPTATIANTVIVPGDWKVTPISVMNMVTNIVAPMLMMSARVTITLRSHDNKPATGSFCVSGRCVGLFAQSGDKNKITFGINMRPEYGICEVFTTPEHYVTYGTIRMLHKANERIVKSLPYLPLTTLANCGAYQLYAGSGSTVSIADIDGNIAFQIEENVVTLSGTGLAKLRIGIPNPHEINLFLYEQTVSISASYDIDVIVITCQQN